MLLLPQRARVPLPAARGVIASSADRMSARIVRKGCEEMPYAQIHTQALRHPKLLRLSDAAFRLWVAGLLYCQEHLTDGLIPRFCPCCMRHTRRLVDELTAARLWHESPKGFEVHDYLEWNDSRQVVEGRRRRWREKKSGTPRGIPPQDSPGNPNVTPARSTRGTTASAVPFYREWREMPDTAIRTEIEAAVRLVLQESDPKLRAQ